MGCACIMATVHAHRHECSQGLGDLAMSQSCYPGRSWAGGCPLPKHSTHRHTHAPENLLPREALWQIGRAGRQVLGSGPSPELPLYLHRGAVFRSSQPLFIGCIREWSVIPPPCFLPFWGGILSSLLPCLGLVWREEAHPFP